MTASGFVGADPEQLEALSVRLDQGIQSLEAIRSQVTGSLGRVHWEGHDGDRFRDDWHSHHAMAIAAACDLLREAARALRKNAMEQREASGAAVAGPGGHTAGGSMSQPETMQRRFEDIGRLVEGGQALIWAGDLLGQVGQDHVLVGSLNDFHHLARMAGQVEIGPLDGIALGLDLGQLVTEIQNGDVHPSTLWSTAWDAASLYPPVGLLTGAWDAGSFIGEQAANVLQEKTHYQDAIFDSIVADKYDGPLTPSQADELVQRYSGWDGGINMGVDLLTTEAHFIGDGVKSLWSKVF
jgi:hypothetical protein